MENNAFNAPSTIGIKEMDLTGIEESNMVSDNPRTLALTSSSSASSSELELYASEDHKPIHVDAPMSHSFTDGTNFNID